MFSIPIADGVGDCRLLTPEDSVSVGLNMGLAVVLSHSPQCSVHMKGVGYSGGLRVPPGAGDVVDGLMSEIHVWA
jgi:hypothetical protein